MDALKWSPGAGSRFDFSHKASSLLYNPPTARHGTHSALFQVGHAGQQQQQQQNGAIRSRRGSLEGKSLKDTEVPVLWSLCT